MFSSDGHDTPSKQAASCAEWEDDKDAPTTQAVKDVQVSRRGSPNAQGCLPHTVANQGHIESCPVQLSLPNTSLWWPHAFLRVCPC